MRFELGQAGDDIVIKYMDRPTSLELFGFIISCRGLP